MDFNIYAHVFFPSKKVTTTVTHCEFVPLITLGLASTANASLRRRTPSLSKINMPSVRSLCWLLLLPCNVFAARQRESRPCMLRATMADPQIDVLLPCRHARFGTISVNMTSGLVAASPPDACSPLGVHTSADILLVPRGKCSFYSKAVQAMRANVGALIISDSKVGDEIITLIRAEKQEKRDPVENERPIPVISVLKETGDFLAKLGPSAQVTIVFGEPTAPHGTMMERVETGLASLAKGAGEQALKELGDALKLCASSDKECVWLWYATAIQPALGKNYVGLYAKMLFGVMTDLSTSEEHKEVMWLIEASVEVAGQLRLQSKPQQQEGFWEPFESMLRELGLHFHTEAGNHMDERGQFLFAESSFKRAINLTPDKYAPYVALARILRASNFGRVAEADAINLQALALAKNNVALLNEDGSAVYEVGLMQYQDALSTRNPDSMREALDYFNKSVQINPSDQKLVLGFADHLEFKTPATGLTTAFRTDAATKALQDAKRLDPTEPMTYFRLAKLLHKQKAYAEAFDQFAKGNQLRYEQTMLDPEYSHYDQAQSRRHLWHRNQHQTVTDEFIRQIRDAQLQRDEMQEPSRQIFIVGMPRSGTSMLEQMLSMHPMVHAIGEDNAVVFSSKSLCYETWADYERIMHDRVYAASKEFDEVWSKCGPANFERFVQPDRLLLTRRMVLRHRQSFNLTAPYIISKGIGDWAYVGYLMLLFPDAKFLHPTREFHDIGLGIYMQDFGAFFGDVLLPNISRSESP
jgi:tetratricopeptide (TPR) repeat protein